MKKRKIIISISGVMIIVLAFLISRYVLEGEQAKQETKAPKTAVNSSPVTLDTITGSLQISGRVIPSEAVSLFAEVGGTASFGTKPFKTGVSFQKGDLLLSIENAEFQNTIISSKSRFKSLIAQTLPDIKLDFKDEYAEWQQYLFNFDIQDPIQKLPETDSKKLSLFLSGRNIYSNYYSIKEQEERLSKYYIKAPFDGALTQVSIDEAALVRVGQPLGEFVSLGSFELESSIQNEKLNLLKPGQKVQFREVNETQSYIGELTRINEKVEAKTQLVKIYFQILSGKPRAGTYLKGNIESGIYENATRIPGAALVEDNQVFVIENGIAKLKKVEVLEYSHNEAIISGISEGAKIITDNKNSAFEGSKVIEMQ